MLRWFIVIMILGLGLAALLAVLLNTIGAFV